MPVCAAGHRHNTAEGVTNCALRLAHKRSRRAMRFDQLTQSKPVPRWNFPARAVQRGPFVVAVFGEDANRPFGAGTGAKRRP